MGIKSAIDDLANAVGRVPEALPKADPSPATLGTDPTERAAITTQEMVDLTLPKSLRDWLTRPLASLGFTIETKKVQRQFSPERSYDVIKNLAGDRSILQFPKAILEHGTNWESVGSVITALPIRDQPLLVVSEKVDLINIGYSVASRVWQQDFHLEWIFLPWGHLEQIKVLPETDQVAVLTDLLKLETLRAEALKLPISQITPAEIMDLTNIVSTLRQYTDKGITGWRLLMEQAELEPLIVKFDFKGDPETVAYKLISDLRVYAPLPTHPEDQVLGLLLCHVLTIKDLNQDSADKIKTILKTYKLAPSRGDL